MWSGNWNPKGCLIYYVGIRIYNGKTGNGAYCDLQKEELLYIIIGDLIEGYSQQLDCEQMEISENVERACEYIEKHYATNISLADLNSFTGFSKYHFIRMFTREKGISPYRYIIH